MGIKIGIILFLFTTQLFSQSQDEILRDLREENVPFKDKESYPKDFYLEKLRMIYLAMGSALETKDDKQAIEEGNKLEKAGITPDVIKIRGKAELGEEQVLYLKICKLRAEAYYNLREFKSALPDSKFIVENHPRPVVFDFTRYAVSLYYSGNEKTSKRILEQANTKFKNENDRLILSKTIKLLFNDY
jgi:hypothetical protein